MARRRIRLAATKVGVAHGDTQILNAGGGSNPSTFPIMETEAGVRTTTGATQTIQDSASTGEVCRTGDIIKYVNLFLQAAPRATATTPTENPGWLEWAFVCVRENENVVPITTTGTQTLGIICRNMFRNECLLTGNLAVGLNQANSVAIQIKIPKTKQKIKIGDEWRFITWFRSWSSTNTDTNNVRVIKSFMYKAYS